MDECEGYTRGKRLSETIDRLTEENRCCFLGVLQALMFAQHEKETVYGEMTHHERAAVIPGVHP